MDSFYVTHTFPLFQRCYYSNIVYVECWPFRMWTRAVWEEAEREEEGVIPDIWVKDGVVYWPPGVDATKAMKEQREPTSSWRKFKLVKTKITSGIIWHFAYPAVHISHEMLPWQFFIYIVYVEDFVFPFNNLSLQNPRRNARCTTSRQQQKVIARMSHNR